MSNKDIDFALFKFGIIVPILNKTHGFPTAKKYIDFIVAEKHEFNGQPYELTSNKIHKWITNYRKYGINGLESKTRRDYKTSRKLNPTVTNRIIDLREK